MAGLPLRLATLLCGTEAVVHTVHFPPPCLRTFRSRLRLEDRVLHIPYCPAATQAETRGENHAKYIFHVYKNQMDL